ncbi:hypothetical protein [Peristeroidobacter soli]|uniref:hypothetical protein n=1 Tax=Peristeroidobacter soli TaxID=2497877 RepID=UPI00101D74E5|nr:hypothetical protein [Peristeroidobacter soli]
MSGLSAAALDSLGFQNGLEIEATFRSLNIYSLAGVRCSPSTLVDVNSRTVEGTEYQAAIGFSVNDACQRLIGKRLLDDELKWSEERSCLGPYLLIEVRTDPVKKMGRAKDSGESITTYDMFTSEKAALGDLEKDVLPRVVLAVSGLFQVGGNQCTARHVTREVFGLTPDLRLVHDIRFSLSATGSYSRHLSEDVIRRVLDEVPSLASEIDRKVAALIYLATNEVDALKRFLFFFLAVEVETHRSFGATDVARISSILDASLPSLAITTAFLKEQPERLKTLKERFFWCSIFAWPGMTTTDVDEFVRLKAVRDKVSHGQLTEPPSDAVTMIEKLALRLQRYRISERAVLKMLGVVNN